jgi:hypothetical protein
MWFYKQFYSRAKQIYFEPKIDVEEMSFWLGQLFDEFQSAQHRVHLTAYGVSLLAFLAGFGICWFVFVR